MSWSVSILTAAKRLHTGPAASVTLPTVAGQLTLLPGHVPLLGLVVAGTLEVRDGTPPACFAVGAGGLEVTERGVVVMAESAVAVASDVCFGEGRVLTFDGSGGEVPVTLCEIFGATALCRCMPRLNF